MKVAVYEVDGFGKVHPKSQQDYLTTVSHLRGALAPHVNKYVTLVVDGHAFTVNLSERLYGKICEAAVFGGAPDGRS